MRTNSEQRVSRRLRALGRALAIIALLSLSAGFSIGCDRQSVTIHSDNQPDTDVPDEDPDTGEDPLSEDDEKMMDDDAEHIETGLLSGSWRVAMTEGDAPVAYFDIFHDQGASDAQGTYWMMDGLSEMLDGLSGDLNSVELQGDDLTITFNPTTDLDELYTLTLSRDNDDLFTGSMTAVNNPNEYEITFGRRIFEDDTDAQ
ncbi:hypothetical protein EA187_10065 [Lujinxingia sediminis]|uniref:Lipocalin-like domain-containing protein n=1 Tax=Lujinxingia sediminis TaxID=2480984 RepID=A0ABY0CTU0_9DELT|nr:hypothetical protein [Lujinxingia sediminis]RVU44872.1 hypothetical protein EA187_10065 [Lujinxingia sediminis]